MGAVWQQVPAVNRVIGGCGLGFAGASCAMCTLFTIAACKVFLRGPGERRCQRSVANRAAANCL